MRYEFRPTWNRGQSPESFRKKFSEANNRWVLLTAHIPVY